MKDTQFLTEFRNQGGSMAYTDALNFAISLGVDFADLDAFVGHQLELGHLDGDPRAHGKLRLTDSGRIFILEAEESAQAVANQKADEKAAKKADRKFQINLTLLASFLSFFAGLIVEHFTGIVELFAKIFD